MQTVVVFMIVGAALVFGWQWIARFFGSAAIGTVVLITLLVGSCVVFIESRTIAQVRYRVTVTLDVDGERKAASAVQAIEYRQQGYANGGHGWTITGFRKGSAPIIDLGERGMLAASTGYDNLSEWRDQNKRGEANCDEPKYLSQMFNKTMRLVDKSNGLGNSTDENAVKTFKARLAAMPKGIQVVDASVLPAFIWFPPQSSFMDSRLVCPGNIGRVIGRSAELTSVTVEVVSSKTPIDLHIAQSGPWLSEMRQTLRDAPNRSKVRVEVSNKAYKRLKQLEMADYWEQSCRLVEGCVI